MSLYNLLNGVNPATFLVLPMLGKHPDEYPRFRDCFVTREDHPTYKNHIFVYTRTGGPNRNEFSDQNKMMLMDMKECVANFDDKIDNTFALWVFTVPEKWKPDYDKIINGQIQDLSPEYQAEMKRVYPKLADQFDKLFSAKPTISDQES